ncbi:hypothetical protein GCM10023324_43890 [Streptomyces youssoufiensis]
MSVFVRLIDEVESAEPSASTDGWTFQRSDNSDVAWEYEVHPSGALVIHSITSGQHTPEVVYAPGAWLKVAGHPKGAHR